MVYSSTQVISTRSCWLGVLYMSEVSRFQNKQVPLQIPSSFWEQNHNFHTFQKHKIHLRNQLPSYAIPFTSCPVCRFYTSAATGCELRPPVAAPSCLTVAQRPQIKLTGSFDILGANRQVRCLANLPSGGHRGRQHISLEQFVTLRPFICVGDFYAVLIA